MCWNPPKNNPTSFISAVENRRRHPKRRREGTSGVLNDGDGSDGGASHVKKLGSETGGEPEALGTRLHLESRQTVPNSCAAAFFPPFKLA